MAIVGNIFERECLAGALSPYVLPIAKFENEDIEKLREDLEEKIESSGCYPGICMETLNMIRDVMQVYSVTERELPGEGDESCLRVLSSIDEAFSRELPNAATTLIVNNALMYIQSFEYNYELFDRFLSQRADVAENYFSVDRDLTERETVKASKATMTVACKETKGSLLGNLCENLEPLFPSSHLEEIKELLAGSCAMMIELMKSRNPADELGFYSFLLGASRKTFPLDYERFYSLGFNASSFFGNNEIQELRGLIEFETPLLRKEVPPIHVGFTNQYRRNSSNNPVSVDKMGFHIAHEATRFVEKERIPGYIADVKQRISIAAAAQERMLK